MNSSSLYSLMITLCLILISHSLSPANARVHDHDRLVANDPDFVSQICNEIVDDKMNCTNILRADPTVMEAKTPYEFSKGVLELALKKGKEGKKILDKILEIGSNVGIAECGLADYVVAVANLNMAIMELKQDPQSAIRDAKGAANEVQSCEASLIRVRTALPDLSTLNHQISLLSNIAVLATNIKLA